MDLEQRMAHLERRTRVLSGLLGLCALALIVAVATAAVRARAIPDELVARSIRVIGDAGKNQATLAATSDGFVILSFRDLSDSQRFIALMTPSGKVSLDWLDHVSRQTLGVIDGPVGQEFSLALKDRDGKLIWQPPVRNPF